jgi:hypothetical protein
VYISAHLLKKILWIAVVRGEYLDLGERRREREWEAR